MARGLKSGKADLIAKAGPVAAIVVSVLLVLGSGLADRCVKIVGDISAGLPPFVLPSCQAELWQQLLLLPAVLVSLLGCVESVSVAQTLAAKRRHDRPRDWLVRPHFHQRKHLTVCNTGRQRVIKRRGTTQQMPRRCATALPLT